LRLSGGFCSYALTAKTQLRITRLVDQLCHHCIQVRRQQPQAFVRGCKQRRPQFAGALSDTPLQLFMRTLEQFPRAPALGDVDERDYGAGDPALIEDGV
jgi:hypothetical protein